MCPGKTLHYFITFCHFWLTMCIVCPGTTLQLHVDNVRFVADFVKHREIDSFKLFLIILPAGNYTLSQSNNSRVSQSWDHDKLLWLKFITIAFNLHFSPFAHSQHNYTMSSRQHSECLNWPQSSCDGRQNKALRSHRRSDLSGIPAIHWNDPPAIARHCQWRHRAQHCWRGTCQQATATTTQQQ